jgi:nuclease S1
MIEAMQTDAPALQTLRPLLLLTAVLALTPLPALAWGTEGHQVIAGLALAKLTPAASREAARLLALEPDATLVTVSTWADEHRNPATAPWHYINFPRDSCTYTPQRDCPDGKCVIEAIARQQEVLKSTAPDDKRLAALKYLVHFVADVHQPLHAGYAEDRGGNTYQLQAFMRGSNLHALWDTGLIRSTEESPPTMTARLLAARTPAAASDPSIPHAAEESCRLVGTSGFYPERRVGSDYIQKFLPTMEQRLLLAGARLAAVLNQTLPR